MRTRATAIALLLITIVAPASFAAKPGTGGGGGGGGSTSTPTATIFAVNAAAPEFPLYVSNDGNATYPVNFTDDIVIDASFYASGRKNRRGVTISLVEPAHGTTFRPFTQQTTSAHLVTRCGVHGVVLGDIVPGNPALCALLVTFSGGDGRSYRIAANGNSPNVPAGEQQGEFAKVECLAQDQLNQCIKWRVTPSGTATGYNNDPNAKSLSLLLDHNTNEVLGYYYMSFHIEASK